jgi:hypothetical protein
VRRSVPHDPRPLAPGSLVGLGWVGGAPDGGGERIFPIRQRQPLQVQRPANSVKLSPFRGPPCHQAVHGIEVGIDRVAVAGGLGAVVMLSPFLAMQEGEPGRRLSSRFRCSDKPNALHRGLHPELELGSLDISVVVEIPIQPFLRTRFQGCVRTPLALLERPPPREVIVHI